MVRVRTRIGGSPTDGRIHRSDFNQYLGPEAVTSKTGYGRCEDDVGKGKVNPFFVTTLSHNIERLTGTLRTGTPPYHTDFSCEGKIPTAYLHKTAAHLPIPTLPTASAGITSVMARTNPSRSSVSLPSFIGELKDLPRMVRTVGDLGRRLRRSGYRPGSNGATRANDLASLYLSGQFGVSPLAGDLAKLALLPLEVERRFDEIRRMQRRGGLSRKRTIASGVVTGGTQNVPVHSTWVGIACRQTVITKYRMWGSVRWTVPYIPALGGPRDFEAVRRVLRAVSGLNGVGMVETAWQLMPWSWLVDWFGNVDEYLGAHNGAIPGTASMGCVMTQIETTETYTRLPGNNAVKGGGATFTRIDKMRVASSPSVLPEFTLPFFTGRQMSILGALAIQRFRG